MITIYRKTIKDKKLQEIQQVEVGSWIHVSKPTKEDLEKIANMFSLDQEYLNDSIDQGELPRIEKENNNIIIYVRVPLKKESEANTTPITIIITPSNIITISIQDNRVIEALLNEDIKFYTTQKAKFLLNVFNEIVKRFGKHINAINKRVVSKRGKLKYLKNDDIVSLVETEEDLNDFVSSLAPDINIFERILSGKYMTLFEGDEDLMEDLLIDAKQVLDLCKTNILRINNIREAYSTILSNNLNKTMKFLAAITVIFTIPTVVASIYGMNVSLPGAANPFIFAYLMGFITIVIITVLFVFFWKRWL